MPPAIRVENLGKQYMLGEFERYSTFREMIARAVTRPASRLAHHLRQVIRPTRSPLSAPGSPPPACDSLPSALGSSPQTIWALRDVSFEVQHGEVLGIIGRNGAGKSTLLKILSRITEPTTGYAEIRGRVGSLLEVGTGFHPELTGRENVYLNGAILGMSRAEIRRKFDDIVSFAGVEKFIDTPVKRYSSGMQVRLAFAVAAHLDPEILIIDEVLAVGDAEFQKRCLGKMNEVSRSGRTVLFVSHNMAAVRDLCSSVLLLEKGLSVQKGPAYNIIAKYLRSCAPLPALDNGDAVIKEFASLDMRGLRTSAFLPGDDLIIRVRLHLPTAFPGLSVQLSCWTCDGTKLFHLASPPSVERPAPSHPWYEVRCRIPRLPIAPGSYYFNVLVRTPERLLEHVQNGLAITVAQGERSSGARRVAAGGGLIFIEHEWLQ